MKAVLPLVALLAAAGALALVEGTEAEVTPVQKVLELLQGMLEKAKKEKHEEEVQFAAYKEWCDHMIAQKTQEVGEGKEKIGLITAEIEETKDYIFNFGNRIKELEALIAQWQSEIAAATKVRDAERADYEALKADLLENIDALKRAIAVLKGEDYDREQSDKSVAEYGKVSLAQVSALRQLKLIPDDAKRMIDNFLETSAPTGTAVSAPEANAYEFQSGGIIEMLEKLLDKFMKELAELDKGEKNAQHAYDMLVSDLEMQIKQARQEIEEKTTVKAKKTQRLEILGGDLDDTTATTDETDKYLADLKAECEIKTERFLARQKLRGEEIEAIEKAIEIISSSSVKGNAEKHLPTLVQSTATSFAQLRANDQSPIQMRLAEFLQGRAAELKSKVLSALAVRVMEDPFRKIKKMIKDLITKLMEEAAAEADHKGWCDTELATNGQTRKEKTTAVEELRAEMDELEAHIAKLTDEITELSKAVAELDEAMAKATKFRQEEKAKNAETVEDAKEAQTAVAQALKVLQEFYEKAGEATAFVQGKDPAQPEIFGDEAYTGQQGESTGVIGMLEVIAADFSRLEADTKEAEATAQKEYDEFMTESEVDKSSKAAAIEHKTAKKQDREQVLTTKKEDLAGTQKELDAALAYFDKLKPSCVTAPVSYEDRVAAREAEIQSLQEALQVLQGNDIA